MSTTTPTSTNSIDDGKEHIEFRLMKKKPKKNAVQYHIASLQDIADCVTSKNINKFCKEFKIVLHSILLVKGINQSLVDDGTIPADSAKIEFPSFEWIDD